MKKSLLILAKLLLIGWSSLYFFAGAWGLLYVASAVGLTRPELWINFTYGYGCIFSIYCILCCLLPFRQKPLLISGIVMQIIAVFCIVWSYRHFYVPKDVNPELSFFGIFLVLWWLHFLALVTWQSAKSIGKAGIMASE